jgi:hypothetical protein
LPPWISAYESFVADVLAVAVFYGVGLRISEKPMRDDRESITLLKALNEGLALTVNNISFRLSTCADIDAQREIIRGEGTGLLTVPEYLVRPALFGVPNCTGPVA